VKARDLTLAREVLRLRLSMLVVNERIKAKAFRIPIHLALGHEALAVAVSAAMEPDDRLVCSHRNLHYNLGRGATLRQVLDEFALEPAGLAQGRGGSMNLTNPAAGIVYTSSILGNNLCVAAGLALAKKVRAEAGLVLVVTGDGAMEEGSFYESLQFLKTFDLPALILAENNGWSLATQIHERRCPIRLDLFADALDAEYLLLAGNDPWAYAQKLRQAKAKALAERSPVVVEVQLATLGDWRKPMPEFPDGKYINYHAGAAPTVCLNPWPLIRAGAEDPVFVLAGRLGEDETRRLAAAICGDLTTEAAR
jgi:pyruvate dehydrogenase E1 component alpha subunit